jgi:tetratricopeptide (TPR) repeat protein
MERLHTFSFALFSLISGLAYGQESIQGTQQQGITLGQEVVQEYNKDTTNPDLVKDINHLLDSLKNENQLSPETKDLLEKIQPYGLKTDQRNLEPKKDVDITHGAQGGSVFGGADQQDKNANRRGDVRFDLKSKLADENVPEAIENAYRAMEAGQLEAAGMLYKRIIYAEPENKDALFGLASVYQRTGQLPQARAMYSKLLSLDPENWPAMNNFLVLAAEEAPDHAIEEFKRLMQTNPEFAPIPAQIGMIYYKQKKYDDAANYLIKAIQLDPSNLSYRYNLAVIYDHLGRSREAGRLYMQLLEQAQNGKALPESAEKIQERLSHIRSQEAPTKN